MINSKWPFSMEYAVSRQTTSTRSPLSRFNSIWLTESLRLEQQDAQVCLDRPESLEKLESASTATEKERWLFRRAYLCAQQSGELEAMHNWLAHVKLTFFVLAIVALISGASATFGLFGAQEHHVNVLWMLIGLIGIHFVSLVVWTMSVLVKSPLSSGLFGRFWYWLAQRWQGSVGRDDLASRNALRRALTPLLTLTGMGLWRLRAASHSLWLIALTASLFTLLLVFSIRNYSFVLETTIVAPDVFVSLIQHLAAVPAALGFIVPDESMISAALNGGELVQEEDSRRAWASFLCSMLLVYAVIPRFCFWFYARLRLAQIGSQMTLDLTEKIYSDLILAELGRDTSVIRDAAPTLRATPQVAKQFSVKGKGLAVFTFELHSDIACLLDESLRREGICVTSVETGQEKANALQSLSQQPASQVLVVCDGRLSPDRGTLRWMVALSSHAEQLRVLILGADEVGSRDRRDIWNESLLAIGLEAERVFTDEAKAVAWMNDNG